MRKLNVLAGERYNRLTIIKELEKVENDRRFLCRCDCGNEHSVSLNSLRMGNVKSCGCYRKEKLSQLYKKHGKSKLKYIWSTMKGRCLCVTNNRFKYYGKRGITIAEEWLFFDNFQIWALANGYKEGLSIERSDVNGNYEPSNCTWIPKSDQPKNARSNINVTINGETKYIAEWCRIYKINCFTVYNRIKKGNYNAEQALTTPVKKR